MKHGVLLDPSNRLLGGATGDFSLYGGLPAVTIGTARPTPADPALLTVPIATPVDQPTRSAGADDAGGMAPGEIPASPIPDAAATATAPLALQAMHAPAPVSAPTLAPQVAAPVGSGSTAPIIADTSLPLVSETGTAGGPASLTHGLTAGSLAAPVLSLADAVTSVPVALAPALAALTTPVLDTVEALTGTVETALATTLPGTITLLDQTIDATVGAAQPLVDGATDTVGAVATTAVDAVSDTTATLADSLTDTISGTADTLANGVADATATTAATATDTVDALAGTAGDVAATTQDVATAAVDTLAGTTSTAADLSAPLEEGLGGIDPAAGVTTLVSMVESAAVFEVGQPGDQPDAATASTSIIDSLTADEAPAALLGDAAHSGDDAALLHHDDGVPGLS